MRDRLRTSTLWRLFEFLKPKRFQYFAAMFVVAAIFASERVFLGFILKWFTDAVINADMALLKNAVIYWGLYALGIMLVSPLFLYTWRTSVVYGTANLRQVIFRHLQRLPLGYYENRHSGEAMSLLANDVAAAEQVYGENIHNLILNVTRGLAAIGAMLFLKWDVTLLIVVSGMVPLLINTLYAKPLRRVGQETQTRLAELSERLLDLLAGFQIVRTFSLGEWILERFKRSNKNLLDTSLDRVKLESTLASANEFAGLVAFLPPLVGAYMVLNGKMTMGTLMGLGQLSGPVFGMVYSLGGIISGIQGSLAAADRIFAVLDTAPEPETYPATAVLPALSTSPARPNSVLAFQDVQFSYDDDRATLQGITFDVQEGAVAAVVGPSGSGKSTLFRLLMGYYPVESGSVSLLGKPLHAYTLRDLRDLFAFVPQDAYLYTGTVRENIRYGRPDASEAEITAAATAAYAHQFIQELPDGYQTLVGERGARLSGGQRQRIAIARALLKQSPFLLLDEATSALDSESETLVQQALDTLMRGRTTLVIAHRLSTIEKADVIYVVEDGQVVEHGRHQALIGQEGLYHHLYELQFQDS
jgi:ATP-binding cassette, subfamily B, bacterial